jgi:hypothetical protein
MYFARLVDLRRVDCPDIFPDAALPHPGRIKQLTWDERDQLNKCDYYRPARPQVSSPARKGHRLNPTSADESHNYSSYA